MGTGEGKNKKVLYGLFWKFAERFMAQGVSFVVSVVLARLLYPDDYGLIAMILVFITIADCFVSTGFVTALIQKKDSNDLDFSTMFYCSLMASLIAYGVIFIMAPLIAGFYSEPLLINILRVFALRIPIGVYNTIQHAYVSRHMLFRKFFFSTLIGTLISGIVGIALACAGFGVWALVAQSITNTVIDTMVLAFTVDWHPKRLFSWNAAKELMNYGWKVFFAELSGTVFGQLRSFVIAKYYTPSNLAFYNKGQQLPALISNNLSQTVIAVLFPAMSDEGDDIERVKSMTKRATQVLTYILFPMLFCLSTISKPLVIVLFTEKWIDSVPFIQLLSISTAIGLFSVVSLQTIKAIGRSDVLLKLEFVKKPVFILFLIIGVYYGVLAIAITALTYEVYAAFVNMMQLKKYINYGLKEQIVDILPAILLSIATAMIVYILQMPFESPFLKLITGGLGGGIFFTVSSFVLRPIAFEYLTKLLVRMEK